MNAQLKLPCYWWYLPDSGELMTDGLPVVRLEPLVARVFDVLIAEPGRVVSRDELFERVWSDRVVIDAALTRCVAVIRAALNDKVPHRYLETLPKRGYRFIGRIEDCTYRADCAGSATASSRPSIAPCLTLIPGCSTRNSPAGVIR
jgi:DNA-binding winged helix-turn-helix (wHTH) protein